MADTEANTVTFGDRTYSLDRHGFLDPPEQWDENFAGGMAAMLGVYEGLTDEHWRFIRYLRKKFIEERSVPVIVFALADNRLRLSRLKDLFPTGYHRGACKIAGINYKFMYDHNIWLTYENYTTLKTEHNLTDDGFLADFSSWNRRFAHLVASEWDLPQGVTDLHWRIIGYLRDAYKIRNAVPAVFETCKANRIDLDELQRLFPDGYRRGACRMAGLPLLG